MRKTFKYNTRHWIFILLANWLISTNDGTTLNVRYQHMRAQEKGHGIVRKMAVSSVMHTLLLIDFLVMRIMRLSQECVVIRNSLFPKCIQIVDKTYVIFSCNQQKFKILDRSFCKGRLLDRQIEKELQSCECKAKECLL